MAPLKPALLVVFVVVAVISGESYHHSTTGACARVRLGVRGDDFALLEERFCDAGAGAPSLLRASGDRPHHAGAPRGGL